MGRLPQGAGLPSPNGSGAATVVPPQRHDIQSEIFLISSAWFDSRPVWFDQGNHHSCVQNKPWPLWPFPAPNKKLGYHWQTMCYRQLVLCKVDQPTCFKMLSKESTSNINTGNDPEWFWMTQDKNSTNTTTDKTDLEQPSVAPQPSHEVHPPRSDNKHHMWTHLNYLSQTTVSPSKNPDTKGVINKWHYMGVRNKKSLCTIWRKNTNLCAKFCSKDEEMNFIKYHT